MSRAFIPVDLFNPGQVFASLGFLEAADVLCSRARAGFDWTENAGARFALEAAGDRNPFAVVLEFFANCELRRIAPSGYKDPPRKKKKSRTAVSDTEGEENAEANDVEYSCNFPTSEADRMALPIKLVWSGKSIHVTHWADGSSRNAFKLYAGNRSAASIARAMLIGTWEKPTKTQKIGNLKTKGICALWEDNIESLSKDPFGVVTPIGGSFNMDPRGAWTALDVGYSPNDQKHVVTASPIVELLAAVGLENARPAENREDGQTRVRYAVWQEMVTASLARPLLAGARFGVPLRSFSFWLLPSGKNKIVTFAEEEISA